MHVNMLLAGRVDFGDLDDTDDIPVTDITCRTLHRRCSIKYSMVTRYNFKVNDIPNYFHMLTNIGELVLFTKWGGQSGRSSLLAFITEEYDELIARNMKFNISQLNY